jgi:hypothetical protein
MALVSGVWGRAGFEVVCDAGGQLSGPVSFSLGAASAWEVRRVGCGVACLDENGGRHLNCMWARAHGAPEWSVACLRGGVWYGIMFGAMLGGFRGAEYAI